MNGQIERETAQIFQFPPSGARGRAIRNGQANPRPSKAVAGIETAASYGSWYHEQALHDANPARKP